MAENTLPPIDISNADAKTCIKYAADHFGMRISANSKDDTAREKLAAIILDQTGQDPAALSPALSTANTDLPEEKEPTEADGTEFDGFDDEKELGKPAIRTVKHEARPLGNRIRIKVFEDKTDKQPVFVGCNFKGFTIKRGVVVEVPRAVVSVLNNCVREIVDPETDEIQLVPRYPFMIVD